MYTSSGDDYSTEETVIGTWIDGKPIYRKVVPLIAEVYVGSNYYSDIGIIFPSNYESVIRLDMASTTNNSSIVRVEEFNYYSLSGSNYTVANSMGFTTKAGDYAILEYTKTTD